MHVKHFRACPIVAFDADTNTYLPADNAHLRIQFSFNLSAEDCAVLILEPDSRYPFDTNKVRPFFLACFT